MAASVVVVLGWVLDLLVVEKSNEGLLGRCDGDGDEEVEVEAGWLGFTNAAVRAAGLNAANEAAVDEEDEADEEGAAAVEVDALCVLRDGGLLLGAENEVALGFDATDASGAVGTARPSI